MLTDRLLQLLYTSLFWHNLGKRWRVKSSVWVHILEHLLDLRNTNCYFSSQPLSFHYLQIHYTDLWSAILTQDQQDSSRVQFPPVIAPGYGRDLFRTKDQNQQSPPGTVECRRGTNQERHHRMQPAHNEIITGESFGVISNPRGAQCICAAVSCRRSRPRGTL